MSKISLSPNALGSGTLTIAAPNTNSDASITLPAITGGEFIVSNASGNVGIGTSSPTARLHVQNSQGGGLGRVLINANVSSGYDAIITATDVGLEFTAQSNARGFAFSTGVTPTERMRIASDGAQSSVIPGGTTLLPDFACRAWVNFNGTGTVAIRASGNVSSITDNATGYYTVNFTTAMPDANFAVADGGANLDSLAATLNGRVRSWGYTTTSVNVNTISNSSSYLDHVIVCISIFR